LVSILPHPDCRKKFEQNEAKRKAQFEMARKAAAAVNGAK
jgi:hypothetical protein